MLQWLYNMYVMLYSFHYFLFATSYQEDRRRDPGNEVALFVGLYNTLWLQQMQNIKTLNI
jgi:hypothetical protein